MNTINNSVLSTLIDTDFIIIIFNHKEDLFILLNCINLKNNKTIIIKNNNINISNNLKNHKKFILEYIKENWYRNYIIFCTLKCINVRIW